VTTTGAGHITRIDTLRWSGWPHLALVEIHTDQGLVGVGETFYLPTVVEALVHDFAVPLIEQIGTDVTRTEAIWQGLFSVAHMFGYAGSEMRAISAIDIALWDLLGQAADRSIHELIGGRYRDTVRAYNSCLPYGKYADDEQRALTDPGGLAEELLRQGFTAMKLYPWDRFAPRLARHEIPGDLWTFRPRVAGHDLSEETLQDGLGVIAAIRDRVGSAMDILVEGHFRWDLAAAIRICRALEPYQPFWVEDMTSTDSAQDLRRLVQETRVPVAASERFMGRYPFRALLEAGAVHNVNVDLCWTGGITEGRKIADMADAFNLPVVFHDCVGPVTAFANIQVAAAVPNAMMVETTRAFFDGGWYDDVVTEPLPIHDGFAEVPVRPGLGTALQPEFRARKDVVIRSSQLRRG
jgi:L-alanine-DL-glutamate epimerase-like enolase superfamily enzyme